MSEHRVYRTLEAINKEAVIADGFEDAYVGHARRARNPTIAVYDYEVCLEILMDEQEWDRDKAVKFMEEQVCEHWTGDSTPCFVFVRKDYGKED